MATTLIGTNTTSGGSDFFAIGDLAATRFTAVASGTLDTLRVKIAASAFTSLTVGVYTNVVGAPTPTNDVPGTLLGSGTISVNTAGIQSVSGLSIAITSGVVYWLALNAAGGQFNFNGGTGAAGYKGTSGSTAGVLPGTFPATNFGDTGANAGIPMLGEDNGGGATGKALIITRRFPLGLLTR